VAGLVENAVAPAPAYYEPAPTVVYRPATVVYETAPPPPVVTRTVVYTTRYYGE
jgi:hypothetical protein